ncbi:MAG: hypothetical protein LC667_19440 [Thioalkalivibrio sp.]|nr:hypothetical protein [Thioalkalivibrio sp.]
MHSVKAAKLLSALTVLMLFVSLSFRAFVYPHMHPAPGDPYGFSDVIELLLGSALIVVLILAAGFAVVLGIKGPPHNRLVAAWLGLLVVAVALLAGPLHGVVARWASA